MSLISNVTKTVQTIGKVAKKTYGPLAALESDTDPKNFRYPLDVGESTVYPHTVEFQCFVPDQSGITDMELLREHPKTTGAVMGGGAGALLGAAVGGGIGALAVGAAGALTGALTRDNSIGGAIEPYIPKLSIEKNQAFANRTTDFYRRATHENTITMFVPQGTWNDRISNQYAEKSMTEALGVVGAFVDVGSSIVSAAQGASGWKDSFMAAIGQAHDAVNGPGGIEALGAIANANGMDGSTIRDAGLTAIGYALNPQFEMLYSGTNLREFTFDFVMTPRNVKESEEIIKIVKKFKYHASPAYTDKQSGRYIIPPSYFEIEFKFNGSRNENLPKLSTCVLKTVDIDYSGGLDRWGAHADGSPIQVRMLLTFGELEMMHKALRNDGY